jgi:uncharacterized membrane protein YobD (UPF0266 family)
MWVFGIVLFIFSCLFLVVAIYLEINDEAKERDKVFMELLERAERDDRLYTNLTLAIFVSRFLMYGNLLISLLGIFFGSVIIYLYK